jgi:hypothetical protein
LQTDKINLDVPPGQFRIENIHFTTPSSGEIALILEVYKNAQERFTGDNMIFQIIADV